MNTSVDYQVRSVRSCRDTAPGTEHRCLIGISFTVDQRRLRGPYVAANMQLRTLNTMLDWHLFPMSMRARLVCSTLSQSMCRLFALLFEWHRSTHPDKLQQRQSSYRHGGVPNHRRTRRFLWSFLNMLKSCGYRAIRKKERDA